MTLLNLYRRFFPAEAADDPLYRAMIDDGIIADPAEPVFTARRNAPSLHAYAREVAATAAAITQGDPERMAEFQALVMAEMGGRG